MSRARIIGGLTGIGGALPGVGANQALQKAVEAAGCHVDVSDELLIAYVEDRLDRVERERIEFAVARDEHLAQRLARFRAAHPRRRGASGLAVQERRGRLRADAGGRGHPVGPAQVIDLAQVRAERMRRVERTHRHRKAARGFGLLVGLLVGLFTGWFIERWTSGENLTELRAGALLARGALQRALDEQLAGDPPSGAPERIGVRIGVSLRGRAGGYCRTFELTGHSVLDGFACRRGERWQLLAMIDGTAGAHVFLPLPAGLIAVVNANASGQPLDAAGERQAQRNRWQ